MDYRTLGNTGLKVSPLCLGTMQFGGATDDATAERIVAMARDAGVNFIDTADVYNHGETERVTGRLIAGDRDRWVLATKLGNPMGDGPNQRGLSRRWVLEAVEGSLKRLGTDYIDIYYLHKEDHDTPLDETVGAIADLIRAGKVRYLGVSNYRAWRIAEIVHLCAAAGIDAPAACQPYYHALNRAAEVEVLPACGHYGIGVASYSPLARGVLTGKYRVGEPPAADSRAARQDKRMLQTEFREGVIGLADKVCRHAEARGMPPGQFALAWVLNNELVSAVIGGPRTAEQWAENIAALERRLDAEDEAFVDSLVPPGHPAYHGYTDPAYPIEGRVPRR
jgi:aryl-alcohol dehydrogenase-like predicted oxidoreductase